MEEVFDASSLLVIRDVDESDMLISCCSYGYRDF